MASKNYDAEAARLAKLPRAERFDQLLDFPTDYTVKAIGRGNTFSESVRALLATCGYPDVIAVDRPSARGRFVSVTFTVKVNNGKELDDLYTALQALPDLVYLL